jgi:hypothetical protein
VVEGLSIVALLGPRGLLGEGGGGKSASRYILVRISGGRRRNGKGSIGSRTPSSSSGCVEEDGSARAL